MAGPLDGIKVVDCSSWMLAPLATAILGDLGADVIKIEQPGGDQYRDPGVILATTGLKVERNVPFEVMNRNKRGVSVNLKKKQGVEVVYRLIRDSDVFVHNFLPNAARGFGLDYASVAPLNPRLIYAQASAWGLKGEDAEKGGLDYAAAGRVGFMFPGNEKDVPVPQPFVDGLCDASGTVFMAISVLAALQAREHTGKGQMVDVSLFGSTISFATWIVSLSLAYGIDIPRRPRVGKVNPLSGFYRCGDGQWIRLIRVSAEKGWPDLCDILGVPHLEKDPRFASLRARTDNAPELIAILDGLFNTRPRAEWVRMLGDRDISSAPIQRITELEKDPQVIANEYVMDYDHPVHGRQKMVGLPYKFTETPASVRRPCPSVGQHTDEVLGEIGYSTSDIAELRREGVV